MQVRKQQLELDMEQQTGFLIGKGVHQGCILSPCLFNLYAKYIMRNAGLKETQVGIKLPTSVGSSEKQESSRKIPTSALLTMPKPLIVWTTANWKILQEMGISDHLTCLLRNWYAGQEATVRNGHGTTDWFQIG